MAWRLGRPWLLLAWRWLGLASSRSGMARGLGLELGSWLGLGPRLGLAHRLGLGSRMGLDLALGCLGHRVAISIFEQLLLVTDRSPFGRDCISAAVRPETVDLGSLHWDRLD